MVGCPKTVCALLGILSHGILRKQDPQSQQLTWTMVEKLVAALPCSDIHHTGDWVCEASISCLEKVGPVNQVFHTKTDRGSNMIKGYEQFSHGPCTDHFFETDVAAFVEHESVANTLSKGRGIVRMGKRWAPAVGQI